MWLISDSNWKNQLCHLLPWSLIQEKSSNCKKIQEPKQMLEQWDLKKSKKKKWILHQNISWQATSILFPRKNIVNTQYMRNSTLRKWQRSGEFLERVKGVTKTLIFSIWLAHSSHSSEWHLCILPRYWYYIHEWFCA